MMSKKRYNVRDELFIGSTWQYGDCLPGRDGD